MLKGWLANEGSIRINSLVKCQWNGATFNHLSGWSLEENSIATILKNTDNFWKFQIDF